MHAQKMKPQPTAGRMGYIGYSETPTGVSKTGTALYQLPR